MATIPVVIKREDDELLYSWLLRLSVANGFSNARSFVNAFITPNATESEKSRRVLKYDLLEDYESIYKALALDVDKLELFLESGVFSFFAPFMTRDQQTQIVNEAFVNNATVSSIRVTQTKMISELRLCPKCVEQDMQTVGRWYYHRMHQLPGVCVCSIHQEPLMRYHGVSMHEIDEDPLLEPVGLTKSAGKIAEYSSFLLSADLDMCSSDLKTLLSEKIRHQFSGTYDLVKEAYLSKFGDNVSSYEFDRLWNSIYSRQYLDPAPVVRLIAVLFSSLEDFKEAVESADIETVTPYDVSTLNCQLIGRYSRKVIEMQHTCGHIICISPTELTQSWKCPYCEGNSHEGLRSQSATDWTEDTFISEIRDLTGDEYTLLSSYTGTNNTVSIRHNKCGKVSRYKPAAFLDGSRCKYCNHQIPNILFGELVRSVSLGRYEVSERRTSNLFTITDTVTGARRDLTKSKVLQELRRPTPSLLLPLEVRGEEPVLETDNSIIENWIAENCPHGHPIFLEDINVSNIGYAIVKNRLRDLWKKKGLLKPIAPGIYAYSDDTFDVDEIIQAKYLVRNGKRIGYPVGSNALYYLGITDVKPDEYRIVSNKESSANVTGRTTEFLGCKLRIRGSEICIDESNWRILMVLDTAVNIRKYLRGEDPSIAMKKMAEYVRLNGLTPADFSQYQGRYAFSFNAVRALFKE